MSQPQDEIGRNRRLPDGTADAVCAEIFSSHIYLQPLSLLIV
jgi:hypothetical protein